MEMERARMVPTDRIGTELRMLPLYRVQMPDRRHPDPKTAAYPVSERSFSVNELLEISKKLTRAANRWPLSEDRRLDVLRLAKRIRSDAMTETQIELEIIGSLATGAKYADDIVEELGLSRKEAIEILDRMWQMGTLEKGTEKLHDRGRPRVVYLLADEFPFKENNSFLDDLELPV